MTDSTKCPQCGRELVFSGDGRFRLCERCGYKQALERPRRSAKELVQEQKFRFTLADSPKVADSRANNVRELLASGIAAAKAGDADEAYFFLEWVLRASAADADQAKAWLWLSRVYQQPADQRECLEQVLAIAPNDPEARRSMAVLDGRLDPAEMVDPNQVRETAVSGNAPRPAQVEQFTCPQCAARMNFLPGGELLQCEFCGFQHSLAEAEKIQAEFGIGGFEQDFIATLATARGHLQPVAMRAFQCRSCAVDFVLAPETLSVTCPYCDAVYVTKTAETRELLPPQALIPFTVDEDGAKQRLRVWFKEQAIERPKVTPIVGMYLPVWTFDASGEIKWGGYIKKGDDWVYRSGSHYEITDDFRVPATQKLPVELNPILDTFDYQQLVAYDARYLADWPAERYQVALADASLLARKGIVNGVKKRPYRLTGGEDVRDLKLNSTNLAIQSFKLLLLPLWMVHYKLDETVYTVLVNGQKGNVQGQKPAGVLGKLMSWFTG